MSSPTAVVPAVHADPVRRVGGWWIAAFGVAWLGVWMAQLTPVQLMLPTQVQAVFGADPDNARWQADTLDFGIVSGVAAVASLIAYPLSGALSDRTTGRWGRRRPWIVIGTVLFAGSLVALGFQSSLAGVIVWWALASAGFCALSSALTSLISDQVPVGQRGIVSGIMSAPQAVGIIFGVLLVTLLGLSQLLGYVMMAAILVVLVAPFLFLVPDVRLPAELRPAFTVSAIVKGFWIPPRRYPDFGWTLLSRVLVNVGNALGTSLLLYFLIFGLHRQDAADDLIVLTVVYALTSVVASIVCGRLSDLWGRRKVFVLLSSALQALGGILLAILPVWEVALVGAALLGLGYGCFLAIDQALATQVLPAAESRGKDLGIMNLASAIPQAIAPMIGALVVIAFGSFSALFVASAVVGLAGAVTVLPIKSVR